MPRKSHDPKKPRKTRTPKVTALSIDELHLQKVHALTADFAKNVLCGWVGPDIAKSHFDLLGEDLQPFQIVGSQGDYHGKRQMLWEFTRKALGKDTDNYAQEVGDCFPAGTMVRMADGDEKPIESVEIGEMVMTTKGRARRVVSKHSKMFTGELVTVRTKGQPRSVSATPDHRFRMVTGGGEEVWLPIGELKPKDRILIPFAVAQQKCAKYDLAEGLSGHFNVTQDSIYPIRGSNSKPCNRHVLLDERLAWLIGLYLAEGGSTVDEYGRATRVDFNLGSHETDLIEKTIRVLEDVFGFTPKVANLPSKPSVTYVRVNNSAIARFFKRIVPGNTYTKRLPKEIFASPDEVRMEAFRGWIEGDGHERVSGNSAKVVGISVCHSLCQDMYHLCLSLKLKASVNFRQASVARKSAAQVSLYGKSAISVVPTLYEMINRESVRQPWNTRSDICETGFAQPIKEYLRNYVGTLKVHCLEVEEDHSFIANGYGVHNCVSFGGKNVTEYLQCVQIALDGDAQKFRNMFPPYFYGCSRVFIGGGGMWGDGSSGTWLQAAVKKYGVLAVDDPGVPKYTGGVARQWGGGNGPPQQFVTVGQQHLVKTTAQITNADDAANALLNGYPIAVCSNWGYNMQASSDGFHAPRGSWAHCMSIIGFDDSDSSKGLYFIILNSWGDVHGRLKDFATGVDLPVGVLRVKGDYVNQMLAQGDSFAFSQFDGFPDNSKKLEEAMFDLIGS